MTLSKFDTLANLRKCPKCGSRKTMITFLNESSGAADCVTFGHCESCGNHFEIEPQNSKTATQSKLENELEPDTEFVDEEITLVCASQSLPSLKSA